jgi:biotin carboxyl carrier protein
VRARRHNQLTEKGGRKPPFFIVGFNNELIGMKLQAQIDDISHQVEIKLGEGRVFAKVDDREYELEVSQPEPNVFLFKENGKIHEFFVAPVTSPDTPVTVSGRHGDVEVKLIDPKRLRGGSAAGGAADGTAEIKTMMPGKVVRVIAKPGDQVEKGDPVLVVEAMKMQNDLKSPKPGTVKEIRVNEGSTVGAGDILAVIE